MKLKNKDLITNILFILLTFGIAVGLSILSYAKEDNVMFINNKISTIMTVKQLKERLENVPDDMKILIDIGSEGYYGIEDILIGEKSVVIQTDW